MTTPHPKKPPGQGEGLHQTLSTTALLLNRVRAGDEGALNELVSCVEPLLTRWAHGRVPLQMRASYETVDLVQEAFTRAIKRINVFESRGPGAFLAYLRQVLLNCINDELRKREYRTQKVPDDDHWFQTSRFMHNPDVAALVSYDQAMEQLSDAEREAIILRLEFGLSFSELAQEIGKPTANAARMYVSRAVARLVEFIG